jgi:hypothetical protein
VLVVCSVKVWKQTVRWHIDPVCHERELITLLARLDEENRSFLDFHVVPNIDRRGRFRVSVADPWLNRGQALADLGGFCRVVISVCTTKSLA